ACHEAEALVERDAGEAGHQDEASEALSLRGRLASLEDPGAKPASRPVWTDEHRAHPGSFGLRVDNPHLIAGIARAGDLAAPAPPAAGHELTICLEHEVGAVPQELPVNRGEVFHR